MEATEKIIDIYIKDEGYGAVKVLTPNGKYGCYAEGFDNELDYFKRTFPDRKVCGPGESEGDYEFECGRGDVRKLVERFTELGLKVESEI